MTGSEVDSPQEPVDREARAQYLSEAEQPIVADLRSAGFPVNSVWDLYELGEPYPAAFPILLAHLRQGGYPDWVMMSMARAFNEKWAKPYWGDLRDLYVHASGEHELMGLANALSRLASKEHLNDLVALLQVESCGDSRIMFLRPIKRVGGQDGLALVASLKDDPVFGKEATALSR